MYMYYTNTSSPKTCQEECRKLKWGWTKMLIAIKISVNISNYHNKCQMIRLFLLSLKADAFLIKNKNKNLKLKKPNCLF